MSVRQTRWIDVTGLNMIRIVVGSYFMSISLGLIEGLSPPTLFLPLGDLSLADLLGTVMLFSLTAIFMIGLWLRLSSLMLALFVLCTSVSQNFIISDVANIDAFWRDITLVCAILLSYTCLKKTEVRKATLVWRRPRTRINGDVSVVPRRVSATTRISDRAPASAPSSYETSLKPLLKPEKPAQPIAEPEVKNIFASL